MPDTPRLALPQLAASQAQKHVTHNEALVALDALVQVWVLDRDLTAPPGSPTDGDIYIVGNAATGDWTGKDGQLAYLLDGAWRFRPPFKGLSAFVADEQALVIFTALGWTNLFTAIAGIQNLPLLGIGTTADATNPFSAKLNKALWTAKTVAEGGDGDLFYTMEGEIAAIIQQVKAEVPGR